MEQTHDDTGKVVIMHGFANEHIYAIINAIRRELGSDVDVAYATTTPNSLEMRLKEVVKDVSEEHEYLKKHPPGSDYKRVTD